MVWGPMTLAPRARTAHTRGMTTLPSAHARVVVGIDATPRARTTVLWAAEEARLRHCSLVITHIRAELSATEASRESLAAEHELLAVSAEAASAREPGVPVGTQLLRGAVSDELIAFSRTAALLVIGVDQTRSRASHGALGPLEDRVVAHAHCPVVVLPGLPATEAAAHPYGLAVVLPGTVPGPVVELAVAEARLRGTGLRVLVVIDPQRSISSLVTAADPAPGLLETLRQQHPDLRVEQANADGDPLDAVLDQARAADFLVLASEHSDQPWGIRIGALAGPVLRLAPCPVFLVSEQIDAVRAA
jgi:nucleotide-binding universal stress UspA family protein